MTKYILHGGGETKESEANNIFFRETMKGFSGTANVLCVYFAKDKNVKTWNWNALFEADKKQIVSACPSIKINFELANDNMAEFVKQIKKADVIYIRGGITSVLLSCLKQVPDFSEIIKDKIVAGCSAGALVLSKYYYDGDADSYAEGLGILPIKIICHWGEARYTKLDGLKKTGEDLKIYTIPEQNFFVIQN
jgi:peptidase E